MDEQIPWMNYLIWADDISYARARALKARYYGEISYIDACVGEILDTVEGLDEADNTLICFYSDHGEHLGDHHAWQKESFFEQSCNIPFIVRWPEELPKGETSEQLVCLTDLFGIATKAAGEPEYRDGIDVLGVLDGAKDPRERLVGYYREPGSRDFKLMVRESDWKYIFMANGGREQLFNLRDDPNELDQHLHTDPDVAARLRRHAISELRRQGLDAAVDDVRDTLKQFPYRERERRRIYQMPTGVMDFPDHPEEVLADVDLELLNN